MLIADDTRLYGRRQQLLTAADGARYAVHLLRCIDDVGRRVIEASCNGHTSADSGSQQSSTDRRRCPVLTSDTVKDLDSGIILVTAELSFNNH